MARAAFLLLAAAALGADAQSFNSTCGSVQKSLYSFSATGLDGSTVNLSKVCSRPSRRPASCRLDTLILASFSLSFSLSFASTFGNQFSNRVSLVVNVGSF
jgi:hypothetical protein